MHHYIRKYKFTTLFFSILFLCTNAKSQNVDNTEQRNFSNIYNDAIRRYVIYSYPNWQSKSDTLFVQKADQHSDSVVLNVGKIYIKVLDWPEVYSRLDRVESFTLYKFFPLGFANKIFYVSVIPFRTSKDTSGVKLGNGGGCRMTYDFDNLKKRFIFKKVICWGI